MGLATVQSTSTGVASDAGSVSIGEIMIASLSVTVMMRVFLSSFHDCVLYHNRAVYHSLQLTCSSGSVEDQGWWLLLYKNSFCPRKAGACKFY